jgi:peptidoglycan/xylan/chitin deacetylase (PgdA/CDA1 family)
MSGLRARAGRWLLDRRGAIAILLYHRVTALEHDPQQLAVDPAHFDEQLRVLAETCTPVALADVPRLLRAARLPKHPVAVTFDDGYRDNLHEAKPLLERHGVRRRCSS